MYPKALVSSLISKLNSRLSVPCHTSGIENRRPVPAVLVDGISIEPKNHHNSQVRGHATTNGSVDAEVEHQYYSARIDLQVRAADEIKAYEILGDLQNSLSLIAGNPCVKLHEDALTMSVGSSGQVRYQFNEPTETELSQSVQIGSYYATTHDDFDPIESVEFSKTIN